jgi:5'-nucleotidase (lipoprotein e(P4) family)
MSMKPYTNFLLVLFLASFFGNGGLFGEDKKLPNDVRWMRDSQEYQNLCLQIYRQAEEKISQQAKQEQGNIAVVIDLDETVLDNSQYQVERLKLGLGFTQESWSEWVNREQAGLVPGAKAFLKKARKLGLQVVYLSNRMHANVKPTRQNLRALGVLDSEDLFLLRRNKEDTKEIRRSEVVSGKGRMKETGPLKVAAYLGDQMGDFPAEVEEALGTSVFVFPNPMYGKW